MRDDELQSRLSRIETVWGELRDAHQEESSAAAQAVEGLVHRYRRPVYRYLLGILRDPDAADEVFQEFALRLVRGAFRNAQPDKGRFRSLIKATLANLVVDYRNKQNRRPAELDRESILPSRDEDASGGHDEAFARQWREEVLDRAWKGLAQEAQQSQNPSFAVLQYRAQHPEATSDEMASALSSELGTRMTAVGVRQILHRARDKFAHLIVEEVARALADPDPGRIHEELDELGLLPYCKGAVSRSKRTTP